MKARRRQIFVVQQAHCISEKQSHYVLEAIRRRLDKCKLRLSEQKTKITYCKDYRRNEGKDYPKRFDFLGHTFKRMAKKSNRTSGVFLGFDCEISIKARTRIIATWKQMDFQRQTTITLQNLAEMLNAKSRGILNYYGKMNILAVGRLFRYLDYRIAKWVKNKYKSLQSSYLKANDWLRNIKLCYPTLFVHWNLK